MRTSSLVFLSLHTRTFILCVLATLISCTHTLDPCHQRTDDLPCLHVPNCTTGTATYHHFQITNVNTSQPATEPTTGTICYNNFGISIKEYATDSHVFTPWTHCNSPVFQRSSVLEIFVAPVYSVTDNPVWYFELDTAPSGALWAGLSNNSRGNSTTCVAAQGCHSSGTLQCSGTNTFDKSLTTKAFNTSTGWGIEINVPWQLFPPEFQPNSTGVGVQGVVDEGDVLLLPTLLPHPTWRMNFYRYSYPNGANSGFTNYELSGWSPTHDPSFHVPAKFGVIVLV